MTQAYVAVQYKDAKGTHEIGQPVDFPDDVAARLIEVGILTTGPLNALPAEFLEPVTLPEAAPEPAEGVKKASPSKRRKPTP